MAAGRFERLPGGLHLLALAEGTRRHLKREWASSPPHRWMLALPRPEGVACAPHDLRPADPEAGRRLLAGRFQLGGLVVDVGATGDPWDRPSPSRRFAETLHRMDWLRDLLTAGPDGAMAGLRLTLEWSRVFGRWNSFSWRPDILERRVFNLACAADLICARASDAERARILGDLARQARQLVSTIDGPVRAAERSAAAAVAGAALSGAAGDRLLAGALTRLARALPATVLADGGHASRSPRAALELLFDLKTLDQALLQRGAVEPPELLRAMDRLAGAVRFLTLDDGGLPDLQGGEGGRRAYVAGARAGAGEGPRPSAGRSGFQRLDGRSLQAVVDAAPPAAGPWSVTACAQPLALEVLAHGRRMIVSCAWSPEATGPQALRLADGASTLSVGDAACGEPLRGFRAAALGPRLIGACDAVAVRRHEAEEGVWLDLSHDGWARRYHLRHERKLYLDIAADELRGEDRLTPLGDAAAAAGARRFAPFLVRFHLHPDVRASLARDGRSVLLRAEGDETGWWLRNDAREVAIEASVFYQDGLPRRTQQVVLRGQARLDAGARVRWKIAAAEPH
jgi:uncharacterized heparinase superfamily protein